MKPIGLWLACVGLLLGGCGPANSGQPAAPVATPAVPRTYHKIRPAVVADLFYPGQPDELRKTVDRLLAEAKPAGIKNLRGLVCPHAGYEYSGRTAACAYRQAAGQPWERVILLAPTHYADFRGAALSDCDALATPLGNLRVARLVRELATTRPFALNPPSEVQRPSWSQRSPVEPTGPDTPHTWEHSLEVQLPFVQRALPDAEVVPIVLGQVEPAEVAKALEKHLDRRTLLVASSDLSHFHGEADARRLDNACVRAICALDLKGMATQEACGRAPILVLMHLARAKHWKAQLLEQSTSADATGDRSRVVGYAAIAFYDPSPSEPAVKAEYSLDQRRRLLRLARESVRAAVRRGKAPEVDAGTDPRLGAVRACFVTLTKNGELRGCIGSIFPREPLCQAVVHMAQSAATEDPRFSAVEPGELDKIAIEISVLSVPQPLGFQGPDDLLAQLRPGVDGVVLKFARGEATFLPQVWEQLPGKVEFLDHLSRKAGQAKDAWRDALREVLTYQVEAFCESEMKP